MAMKARPSGIPAQAAWPIPPRAVATRAIAVEMARIRPFVPIRSIRTNPVRNVPTIEPTIPQA